MRKGVVLAAALSLAPCGSAVEYTWLNVNQLPGDLMHATDVWDAVRIEDPQHGVHNLAVEDFELPERTEIQLLYVYAFNVGTPLILAGDWYIFDGPGGGPPQTLLAHGMNVPLTQFRTDWWNAQFGLIEVNEMRPNVVLAAGHYFLGFRAVTAPDPSGQNAVKTTSTRWANDQTRAFWNAEVSAEGAVAAPWQHLSDFNGIVDQEWAFFLDGRTILLGDMNCDGVVNFLDINLFVLALTDPAGYQAQLPGCPILNGDFNGDGRVGFDDINAFVAALGGG